MTIHSDFMARSNNSTRAVVTDKREAILRAAIKVFARNGYFNSKVSDIAGEAGIADGTVYLYFKSKEEVLHSVFDTFMDEFLSEAKAELEEIQSPIERLKKLARLHLEKLGSDKDAAIVVQVEFRGSTKFMEEFSAAGFAEYLKLIKITIEDGQKQGFFRQDLSATVCSKILYGALDEMVTNWILSKKQYALAPMANTVLEIFLGGLNK
jgi:TetR/AcrR family fatty acid metabolism transcriptional regulator